MPTDPHRAFRQLQRMLNIDDQGRSRRPRPQIDTTGCKVLGTIVYDLDDPDPIKRVRYEHAKPADGTKSSQ